MNHNVSKTVHDIKNTLSVILSRAELLSLQAEKNKIDSDDIVSSVTAIKDQIQTARELLDTLDT